MSIEVDNVLKNLDQKIKVLLKQNDQLQRENQKLQKEKQEQALVLNQKNEALKQLQHQLDTTLIDIHSLGKEERKRLEQKINAYLKDVEKCLAVLNS